MKPYAEGFYKSKAWQSCRESYLKKVGYLCEDCLKQGIYKPAEIVHHRVFINESNINDPAITLNFSNLKAVCRECHAKEHKARHGEHTEEKRYMVDEAGRVIIR